MYFSAAAERFNSILIEEELQFTESFKNILLSILSEMCNYTEEDHKVRPQIIIGENLGGEFESIKNKSRYYVMYRDTFDGCHLPRIFKSLALFCDNGWYIVINLKKNEIEYGLFRLYTGIAGDRFEDCLKNFLYDAKFLIIRTNNSFEISVCRTKYEDELICQRFLDKDDSADSEELFDNLAEDITSSIEDYSPEYVKRCLKKMFRNFPQKVHGTILIVIEDDYEIPDNILSGIKIEPAIDFGDVFSTFETISEYKDAENVYSITGMLYEMLNTDGITIITDKGKVLYYNVFYKGDIPQDIKGGARKRTAKGILANDNLCGVKGLYFQSQDGDMFYERKIPNE